MSTINIKKTDSISKIKSALMKSGNTIEFEKGTYLVTETLYFSSRNIINFNGSILRMANPIHNILMSYTKPTTVGYKGVYNVQINDVKIEQMYSRYGACKCNSLTLWHCNDIKIKNCTFLDSIIYHSCEINSSSNILIDNCKFLGHIPDKQNDWREHLQLDSSNEDAIFLHKSGSNCYDNSPCKNIIISNCTFDKSSNRKSESFCIGNHSQGKGVFHENITIKNNKFIGDISNKTGCAIRLVGIKNATIENNYSENYARFVFITNYETSHTKNGNNVSALNTTDGRCSDIIVRNNKIKPLSTYKVIDVYSSTKTGVAHGKITKIGNTITK